MSNEYDSPDSQPSLMKSSLRELKALIDLLSGLYMKISNRLWRDRLDTEKYSNIAGETGKLGDSLEEHFEKTAADPSDSISATPADSNWDEAPDRSAVIPTEGSIASRLGRFFRRKNRPGHLPPRLGEKLQSSALGHINKAMRLSRQGNREGAKLHARLAEDSMREAGRYMQDDAYLEFKQRVETRLKSMGVRRV